MAVAQRKMTLEEFLKLPEEEPALEFADGEVCQKVSPKLKHSALQLDFGELIDAFGIPRKVARAFPELRTAFAGRSRVPDVAVYRWERSLRTPKGELAEDALEPPDVAVEIASPEQSVNAQVSKCLWYVENGVHLALLVDAQDRSVLLFRPGVSPRALRDADPIDLSDVLPGFQLTIQELFAALDAG